MGKSSAEKLLNELRRVKSNKTCADCATQSRFGFSHVCVKYNIFVCPKCKSAHQAYSHRVKVGHHNTPFFLFLQSLSLPRRRRESFSRSRFSLILSLFVRICMNQLLLRSQIGIISQSVYIYIFSLSLLSLSLSPPFKELDGAIVS